MVAVWPLTYHLYHGTFMWDRYLRKGLDPSQTRSIAWLPKGEPRRWAMAGGSDAHGDLNFRRHGRPNKCIKLSGVKLHIKQWCDTPVSDTAIGTPRNLVHVGAPKGDGSGSLRRHSNRQVINSLEAGRFSVTDGPALRVVIDKNRNGKIDAGDYEMGSVVDIFPGEQIPVLVEWFSTPEFGAVQRLDLYFGNKQRTYAAPGHGPNGRFGHTTSGDGTRKQVTLSDPYAGDPSGVLATTKGMAGPRGMHGLAKFMLDPKQFDITGGDGTLFYMRAYVQTRDGAGNVAGRMAFSNPVWGRYHTSCDNYGKVSPLPRAGKQPKASLPGSVGPTGKARPAKKRTAAGAKRNSFKSIDRDDNGRPDVCEGKAPKVRGSTRTVVVLGGPPKVSPPKSTPPKSGGAKPKGNTPSKQQPGARPSLPPAGPAKKLPSPAKQPKRKW